MRRRRIIGSNHRHANITSQSLQFVATEYGLLKEQLLFCLSQPLSIYLQEVKGTYYTRQRCSYVIIEVRKELILDLVEIIGTIHRDSQCSDASHQDTIDNNACNDSRYSINGPSDAHYIHHN